MTKSTDATPQPLDVLRECSSFVEAMCTRYTSWSEVKALHEKIDLCVAGLVNQSATGPHPSPDAHMLAVQVLGSYTAANVPFDALDINAQRAVKLALEVVRLNAAEYDSTSTSNHRSDGD